MYELIQITPRDFYIQSPAKIGLVRTGDTEVILIDSGSDKDAGKKALRHIENSGWTLRAIYNTHSHADHIGGNRFLQDRTDCEIFAPGVECAFTNHPILEPALLSGGNPPAALHHKFLMAQESRALPLTADALPEGFSLITLPGHSPAMCAILTPDGTLYAGDSVSSKETLDKYGIGYVWDAGQYLASLEKLADTPAEFFVPSHAEAAENIADLITYNIEKTRETAEIICALCTGVSFENLLAAVFEKFGLMMSPQQHALIGSALRAYLTYLESQGRVASKIENNFLLWEKC